MKIEIISIGDELLTGFIVNGNAAWIGEQLTHSGHHVIRISTVGDDERQIADEFDAGVRQADAVIATGGLGPTEDDLTRHAVAHVLDCSLKFYPEYYARIQKRFEQRNIPVPESNRIQADIPEKADPIPNTVGTAPGIAFHLDGKPCFVLPGVPKEMQAMLTKWVLPRLDESSVTRVFESRLFKTVNISESGLQDRIKEFASRFPDIKLAFLPRSTGVVLRLMLYTDSRERCFERLNAAEVFLRERAGEVIYATDADEIEDVVGRLLLEKGWTIATAESCTGGLIGHKLTQVSGSSAYFDRGVVTYSNAAKIALLDVPEAIIQHHGAVSVETAQAMAEGVRNLSGTDIGISVTGIAGPSGGTPEKPVGLVYIGYSDPGRTLVEQHRFFNDRHLNKERSAIAALDLVRRELLGHQ